MSVLKKYYGKCVYAIKHSDTLNELIDKKEITQLEEKKIWRTAKMILAEAKNADQSVVIFFAPAEGTIFLHSFAELVSVDIKAESRATIYQIRNLNVLPPNIRKSSLLMLDGKNISPDFIRSYTLCRTPYSILNLGESV